MEKKYFLVKKSIIYRGKVQAKNDVIVELPNPNDVLYNNLLKLVAEDKFDDDAVLIELSKDEFMKLKSKKQVFIPQGLPKQVFDEVFQEIKAPVVVESSEISEISEEVLDDESILERAAEAVGVEIDGSTRRKRRK